MKGSFRLQEWDCITRVMIRPYHLTTTDILYNQDFLTRFVEFAFQASCSDNLKKWSSTGKFQEGKGLVDSHVGNASNLGSLLCIFHDPVI